MNPNIIQRKGRPKGRAKSCLEKIINLIFMMISFSDDQIVLTKLKIKKFNHKYSENTIIQYSNSPK